jgi:tetratricopeptide (TPR) repeat protein
LLGAVLAWRRGAWPRLLVLLVVVYSATVILFFVFSRFRVAMLPALYVLAAYAAVALWGSVRRSAGVRGAWRRTGCLVLGFVLLAAFVNLPVRGREDGRSTKLARALGLPVRIESSSAGHFNLGVAYAARAKGADDPEEWLALAEEELLLARETDRRHAAIPIELGKVRARRGRNAEAVEAYLEAATIEPDNFRVQHALGLLYRRLEDLGQAEAAFSRALRLEPRHVASAVELGEVLLQEGRREDAAAVFRHALGLSPGSERARRGLAEAESAP